ncbi:TAF1D isoform 6 [Pan troglodytes]|uniref:TATA-box binding protein associated factor, RNA polymerase I subunit D n=3 Tax=Hominidae TaxID=9604 RepID=E9PKU8_HUMAN|nr:TAF1D isoform 6 [Pan troglodytes]PNJ86372.1 TAF1D isoform 18 [Pongo abelii]
MDKSGIDSLDHVTSDAVELANRRGEKKPHSKICSYT